MNSDDLNSIQNWMQDVLIHSDNKYIQRDVEHHIAPSAQIGPRESLAIYQRSYYARLLECMRQQYKALCHALGNDLFNEFAHQYLKSTPSRSATLSELGADFSEYLESSRPDKDAKQKEVWINFMVDLARYEWDLYSMFDAKGWEGNPYANIDTDDQSLVLQPCFKVKEYEFPVNLYYKAIAEQEEVDIPLPQKTYVAICRKDYLIGITPLLEPQHYFLSKMQEGRSVTESLELTCLYFEKPINSAKEVWKHWRKTWISAGFFRSMSHK